MTPPNPSLDTLRRQLEGRWEHIERARERYAELQRRLESSRWRRELRGRSGLLRETLQKEGELQEVLASVEQRARGEQWPAEHPGLAVLRELEARRTRLKALVHKRLARPAPRDAASWTKGLEQLEAVVQSPVPLLPNPTEFVLLEGKGLSELKPGQFWVTPERLVWRPWGEDPEEVKLAPIETQQIGLIAEGLGVRVEGPRRLDLLLGRVAPPLVKLLDLCRRLPGLRRAGTPMRDVVVSPAYSHAASYREELSGGMALFWPGFVAFLPTRRLTPLDHLLRWVGKEVPLPTDPELLWQEALVEHLRQLPAREFNLAVRGLVQARGGACWPATEVHRGPDDEGYLRFEHGKQVLLVPPSARLDTLRPFLERHVPSAAVPGTLGPEKRGWTRAFKNPLLLALGVAVSYVLLLRFSLLLPGGMGALLSLLGRGAMSWVFMRYAKARGHHPLLGLALSVVCPLGAPFLLLVVPKPKLKRSPRLK